MNPVISREFFGLLRTRKATAILVSFSAAVSLVVLLRWPTDAFVDPAGARAQQVFRAFCYVSLAGFILLLPAIPATSIVRERIKGTLQLLINSPLSLPAIYFGKLFSSCLFALLLLITSLPAAAACYAMGGIDPLRQLVPVYLLLTILAVEYSALGLLVSAYVRSTDAGVRVTYALVFSLSVLTMAPFHMLQGRAGWLAEISQRVYHLSPLPLTMEIVGQADIAGRGIAQSASGLVSFFTMSAVLTAVLIVWGLARLGGYLFERSRPKGVITDDCSVGVRGYRRIAFLVDPQRRKSGIAWYTNPVMMKEFRSRRFGRSHWLIRMVAICVIASMLLTWAAATGVMDWGVNTIGGLLVMLQLGLLLLVTPSLAAGIISSERECGGWELLRMTPLSTWSILRGKLMSVAWTMLLILVATLPGYLVLVYIQPARWLQVYLVVTCFLLATINAVLVTAAVGSFFSRTATATSAAFFAILTLFLGPFLVWAGRDAPFGHSAVQAVLSINPIAAALSVLRMPGFVQYELIPVSWWITGAVSLIALAVLMGQLWRLARPT
jgi:ABC-type transport system involved in multi-copper enzyme maturation permease subunit